MLCRPAMSINMLPDDILLEVFDFVVIEYLFVKREIEAWQSLVHVCQRWRSLVFGSPHRLNLRLYCVTHTQTRVKDTLDVWPAFPLLIRGGVLDVEDIYGLEDSIDGTEVVDETEQLDNTIAALGRSDRVCQINLMNFSSSFLENVSTAMQKPFPELTSLQLSSSKIEAETALPDLFLGGSAPPRLRYLTLVGIPFPGLPKLLSSATHLGSLDLDDIPHSGYISPEAIVTVLSTLTCLSSLYLGFRSPLSRPEPESRRPPPLTRSVIPSLFWLCFIGVGEYLEDLVARINTPRLNSLSITFFNQIVFDTPQTIQFINRTSILKTPKEAHLIFEEKGSKVNLKPLKLSRGSYSGCGMLTVRTSCEEFDWQVSALEQVCTSCLPSLSVVEDLYIEETPQSPPCSFQNDIDNALWLQLLSPFPCVKNLYLIGDYAKHIAPALQELVGGRTTEVLPALENIFLEGLMPSGFNVKPQEGIVKFVAARQLTDYPISLLPFSLWDTQFGGLIRLMQKWK